MSNCVFRSSLDEDEVKAILDRPEVRGRLTRKAGAIMKVTQLKRLTYEVIGAGCSLILRFPADARQLSVLKKEERIRQGLEGRTGLPLPDTQVIDDLSGQPAFAFHRAIPGGPLTTEAYDRASPEARDRLAMDLAAFLAQTHRIPLSEAGGWLETGPPKAGTSDELALDHGMPDWFSPEAAAKVRASLSSCLEPDWIGLLEETISRFQQLAAEPAFLVFGHGDLHGYNMAIVERDSGPQLAGIFDLGCAGIIDLHEDFFRLALVSEDLLERVIKAYQEQTGRMLNHGRITTYYRAFLFYLMAGKKGDRSSISHLKALLRRNVEHCSSRSRC